MHRERITSDQYTGIRLKDMMIDPTFDEEAPSIQIQKRQLSSSMSSPEIKNKGNGNDYKGEPKQTDNEESTAPSLLKQRKLKVNKRHSKSLEIDEEEA